MSDGYDRLQKENDELKSLWKRATQFVMPGEFDTSESIIHYIKKLEEKVSQNANSC